MHAPDEHLAIPATDGLALAATLLRGPSPDAPLVLVVPATGVRRRLYAPLAGHLQRAGFGVVTWDWRGTGDSRPRTLRGFRASMRDWAERDLEGVLRWAADTHPRAPLVAVGHSFGGQALGLAPGASRLAAAVTVAAQSGWWGHWPRPRRYLYGALWHVAMPALTRLVGYFPARRLGAGEDLPRDVALEWARWCRSPRYLGDWSGHRRLAIPMLALGFADDAYAPRAAVEALHREYAGATVCLRHVAPADVGARRIGHFGFFRAGVAPALWDEVARWLRARLAPTPLA